MTFGCLGWGGSFGSDGGGNKRERERATVFWDVKNESIKNSAASYCDKQIEDENKSSQFHPGLQKLNPINDEKLLFNF